MLWLARTLKFLYSVWSSPRQESHLLKSIPFINVRHLHWECHTSSIWTRIHCVANEGVWIGVLPHSWPAFCWLHHRKDSMLMGILTKKAFICFLISHRTRYTTRELEWRTGSVGVSIGVHRVPRRRKAKLPRRLAEDGLISSAEHWKENGALFRKRLWCFLTFPGSIIIVSQVVQGQEVFSHHCVSRLWNEVFSSASFWFRASAGHLLAGLAH